MEFVKWKAVSTGGEIVFSEDTDSYYDIEHEIIEQFFLGEDYFCNGEFFINGKSYCVLLSSVYILPFGS